MNRKKDVLIHTFLCLLSPFFWNTLFNFQEIVISILKTPHYIQQKIVSIFALYNLRYILELRSGDDFLSRLFFNKITLLMNNFSDLLNIMSPKTFFIDNIVHGKFELIPFVFVLPWFCGVVTLIKKKEIKLFVWYLLGCMLVFLTDQRNANFLFVPAFVNLAIVTRGIIFMYDKK